MFRKIIVFALLFLPISACVAESNVDIQKQIAKLKSELERQNERIKHLEYLVRPTTQSGQHKIVVGNLAWQNIKNWKKIKRGMSRAQVESILGKPTKVKVSVIEYVTLYYQGEKFGSGYVSGNIQLNENDRVLYSGVNAPVM